MGKGAPLRWVDNKLLAQHLSGRGIEIGALWRKFPVPRRAIVFYVDRTPATDLQQHYAEVESPLESSRYRRRCHAVALPPQVS